MTTENEMVIRIGQFAVFTDGTTHFEFVDDLLVVTGRFEVLRYKNKSKMVNTSRYQTKKALKKVLICATQHAKKLIDKSDSLENKYDSQF